MRALGVCAVVLLTGSFAAAMVGDGAPAAGRVATLLAVWAQAGWTPAAYLLGAQGWGTVVARRVPNGAVAAGLGLAATLGVSLVLGTAGLLGPVTAWAWTGAGLVLLALAACRDHLGWAERIQTVRRDRVAAAAVLIGCAGLGVMMTAAAMPPGTLWASEFGGYDAMSYHLQLPAEWLVSGRIESVPHNVYSFLPGAYEAGVLHLAHLAALPGATPEGLSGFFAGSGDLAMAPSFLALGLAVIAAWCVGGFASELAARCGVDDAGRTRGACFAGTLVLLTPWVHVVGTLAYNETGAVALGAAALATSTMAGLSPVRRGVVVAVLMGAAGGCKPTAVLMLAPECAILMAWTTPKRAWLPMFAVAAVIGLAALSPWMVRNAMAGGNPVFPHATGLFGNAHWSPEQVETYARGHAFDGSLVDRVLMLVRPDPNAGPNAPTVARFRALTNPQWALTPWLGLLGIGGLLVPGRSHKCGAALAGGLLAGLVVWMLATHLQSRFLIMVLPLFAGGFGAVLAVFSGRFVANAGIVLVLASCVWSFVGFAGEQDGHPNRMLVLGTAFSTGRADLGEATEETVWPWINRNIPEGELLLVGDAAPFYYRRPVRYATVWDTNPLAAAMREHPGQPEAWTHALRDDGVVWVLISWSELDRLARSGWSDPMLSPDRVKGWADRLGPPARVWQSGYSLHRIGNP